MCVQMQVCLVSLRGVMFVCVCADGGVFGVSQRSDVCVCVCVCRCRCVWCLSEE